MLNQHLNDKIEHYHQYSGQIVQLMMFNIQSLSLILTFKKNYIRGSRHCGQLSQRISYWSTLLHRFTY